MANDVIIFMGDRSKINVIENRRDCQEEFEDTKGVIIIRISQKNRLTQWPKEKGQKDKRSTKHTHKTKDRVTRTPLKTGGELRCSGRPNSSCPTSETRRVNLVTNPEISHE